MAIRIHIGKILTTMIWCCIGAGMMILLVAAIRYRNSNLCKGYVIDVSGTCISKREILNLVTPAGGPKIQNRPVQSIDLRRLETTLQKNAWVQKARLFFDNINVLHIDVVERTPVAHVFTEDGISFYIDSGGVRLPPLTRLPTRMPVFTSYPSRHRADSLINEGIRRISAYLRQDTDWLNRIARINILSDGDFELETATGPPIGFGDGNDVPAKFHRLLLFDRQVLNKVGLERYARIDVSYAGQVVAIRKGMEQHRYDSLQGLSNIRQLIRSAQQLQPDTMRQRSVRPLETNTLTEQNLSTHDLIKPVNNN